MEMDLLYETENGEVLEVEVSFWDRVSEIKEKIRKNHKDIPESHELTLIFNDQVLPDDWDIEKCGLFHNSRVQLKVSAPAAAESGDEFSVEELLCGTSLYELLHGSEDEMLSGGGVGGGESSFSSANAAQSSTTTGGTPAATTTMGKVRLAVGVSKVGLYSIEMMMNETVRHLKEKIRERIPGVSTYRMKLTINGNTEMEDKRCIGDYNPVDDSKIDVVIRPEMPPPKAKNPTKIKIILDVNMGGRLTMNVNPKENIQNVRNELEKQRPTLDFQLPPEYFFIHNQSVMEEEESLQSQGVRNGDVLYVFKGYVTRGPY